MSDNICPKCGKPFVYVDNVCPKCGKPYAIYIYSDVSSVEFKNIDSMICQCGDIEESNLKSEIARLKAELTNGQELLGYALAEVDGLKAAIEQANVERDEARQDAEFQARIARKYVSWYGEAFVERAEARSEVSRLKAEVERLYKLVVDDTETYAADIEEVVAERDEARRLARKFYRAYLVERKNYLDIDDDENIWF